MSRPRPPPGPGDTVPERLPVAPAAATLPAQTRMPDGAVAAAWDPGTLPLEHERYQVGAEIGRGGLGRVLEAHDRRLDRPVALKELLRAGPDATVRFVREAQLTARLEHPAIVPVHDVGRAVSGAPFYAMKRVLGRPLDRVIHEAGGPEERLALLPGVIAVVEAVAYAHSQGIIHRDLKPSNILVGAYGETVVIDWGLAKDLRAGGGAAAAASGPPSLPQSGLLTAEGSVMGTPIYMAPEQARGEAVDERADVYALGAILYELLAGEPPFRGSSATVVATLLTDGPDALRARQPDAPDDLVSIVGRAMARDRDRRYPTAEALAEDLRRFAAGQLVASHAYSRGELVRRFLRRNRAAVAVAAVLGATLVAFGTLGVLRIVDEKHAAEREREAAVVAARVADERARDLVVLQARNALGSDPTLALAWLKELRPLDAGRAGAAAEIASDAVARGVARHILRGHRHDVLTVAFAPDGTWLASGGADRTVRLWDLATGAGRVLGEHGRQVNLVAFAPDGRHLASVADEPVVRVWDVAGGPGRALSGHERGAVNWVAWLPGGGLATAGEDGTVRLWDLGAGTARTLRGHEGLIWSAAVAPDGLHLASAGDDHAVMLWDLATLTGVRLEGHAGPVRSVAFSPDGAWLASGADDRAVRLWPVAGGPPRVLAGHEGAVMSVRFAPDGQLVTTGLDGQVLVWNLDDGSHRRVHRHAGEAYFAEVTRDGAWLISASFDKTLWMQSRRTGAERVLRGHTQYVVWLAVAGDGGQVASASSDGTIRVWPVGGGEEALWRDEENGVGRVDASPDGGTLASAGLGGVRLWDRRTGTGRLLGDRAEEVRAVRFSPDGRTLAFAGSDARIHLWDLERGAGRTLAGHERRVNELAFSPDGAHLASGSDDLTVRVWDLADDHEVATLRGHQSPVLAVAFSPDGGQVASAGWDKTIRVARLGAGGEPRVLPSEATVAALAFVDDRTLLVGAYDGTVALVEVATGAARTVDRHDGPVYVVAVAPDGRFASAGADRAVHVHAPPAGLRVLRGHTGDVLGLAFTPDGRLATGARDGTLRLWDLGRLTAIPAGPADLEAWLQRSTAARVHEGLSVSPGPPAAPRP